MKRLMFAVSLFMLTSTTLFGENIIFKADSMNGKAGSKTDATTLKGNAFVQTDTMEISADSIELNGDNFRFILATGNVNGKIIESEMEFSCGKVRYDRTTKIARLEDSVHLIDVKNNVTADAQLIEYNQNTEIAVMQISVKLIQKDNTCTSAYSVYRKNDQMLEMSGNPKIVQGEDTFRAQEITLDLDSQEITLDGRVSGTVTDSKKEETKKPAEETAPSPDGSPDSPPPEAAVSNENEENPTESSDQISTVETSAKTEKDSSETKTEEAS